MIDLTNPNNPAYPIAPPDKPPGKPPGESEVDPPSSEKRGYFVPYHVDKQGKEYNMQDYLTLVNEQQAAKTK